MKYKAENLREFAEQAMVKGGMGTEQAASTARLLLEADLMGHTTHGLALCGPYIKTMKAGDLKPHGEVNVVKDSGGLVVWDADYLPGVWVTEQAINLLCGRVPTHGITAVSIRRSGHIGCLQAFLPIATEKGYMIILTSSDPSVVSVAPYGGCEPRFTPDPLAVGIPTDGDPVLVDMSSSITTNSRLLQARRAGEKLPGSWLLTPDGETTDDPEVGFADPPGTILPIGGVEYGHKGFGLALMIEALTQGLGGFGRVDEPTVSWGASVFIQVLDPEAFGGKEAFIRQTSWLAQACRETKPRPDVDKVRLPGEKGLALKRDMLAHGVVLNDAVREALEKLAEEFELAFPEPI